MKVSFQMVLVTFVVTLAHLVVLATLSPTGMEVSSHLSKSEDESMEESKIESFSVVSEIPLSATPEQRQEEAKPEVKEPEAVSVDRDDRIIEPKPADLAEVSREPSRTLPREEQPPSEKGGPHEIRQIVPKPRS